MDFRKAIQIDAVPVTVIETGPTYMTLKEAMNDIYTHCKTTVSPLQASRASKHVDDTASSIYLELKSYWPEFGILNNCTFPGFKNFLLGICNVDASGAMISTDHCPLAEAEEIAT